MKRFMLLLILIYGLPAQQGQTVAGAQQAQAGGRGRGGERPAPDPRTAGGGQCANSPYNCIDTPNPISRFDTVWLEEMTWMDVRDAIKAGKTTVIVSTGGIEPNGPWLALGKHNYILRANCDAIARKLENALCAPILPFVPEGNIDPKDGAMTTVGTISVREETFQAALTDIVSSLKMHGFQNMILIAESGGNISGMQAVANRLNDRWNGSPVVAYIPEYYDADHPSDTGPLGRLLTQMGVTNEGQRSDGVHDDPQTTVVMMVTNPDSVRWEQRVRTNKATINGVSIADKTKALEIGKKVVELRATITVAAIKKAIENKGKSAHQH